VWCSILATATIWNYRGRDSAGKVAEGSMDAETAAIVADRLRVQHYWYLHLGLPALAVAAFVA